jgi:integrase
VGLYKRGSVYWAYYYVDGVRHQASTGTGNRRQAEAVFQKLRQEAVARKHDIREIDPRLTVAALASQFLGSGSARSHHAYHLKFLLPFFGEWAAARLTKSQAAEFRKARRQINPKIKEATINRDLSVLRRICYWGVDEGLLSTNPLARLRMERERKTRRQVLSPQEELRLLAEAAEHLAPIIVAALDTGMRRGEITGQRWEDVDLARRLLFVSTSKTPEGESREIPLTSRLYDWLSTHRSDAGLVFTFHEEPLRIIKRSWQGAVRRAGIRYVRFHDLRHTFNTRLMEAGVVQEVRMALMGHSTGNSVHSSYTHVQTPLVRDAIRRLEAWVNQQQQAPQQTGDEHARTKKRSSSPEDSSGRRPEE